MKSFEVMSKPLLIRFPNGYSVSVVFSPEGQTAELSVFNGKGVGLQLGHDWVVSGVSSSEVAQVLAAVSQGETDEGIKSTLGSIFPQVSLPDWLQELCQDFWVSGSLYRRARAAGNLYRLRLPSLEEVQAKARETLSGRPLAQTDVEIWAQTLTEDQVETIKQKALTGVKTLWDQLSSWTDQDQEEEMETFLLRHCRDNLESVATILHMKQADGGSLRKALESLDAEADKLCLPNSDARLRASSIADPDGWWTRGSKAETSTPQSGR